MPNTPQHAEGIASSRRHLKLYLFSTHVTQRPRHGSHRISSPTVPLASLSSQFLLVTVNYPHSSVLTVPSRHNSLSSEFPLFTVPCPHISLSSQSQFPVLTVPFLTVTVCCHQFPVLTVPSPHGHSSLSSQFPVLTIHSPHSHSSSHSSTVLTVPSPHSHSSLSSQSPLVTVPCPHSSLSSQFPVLTVPSLSPEASPSATSIMWLSVHQVKPRYTREH